MPMDAYGLGAVCVQYQSAQGPLLILLQLVLIATHVQIYHQLILCMYNAYIRMHQHTVAPYIIGDLYWRMLVLVPTHTKYSASRCKKLHYSVWCAVRYQ